MDKVWMYRFIMTYLIIGGLALLITGLVGEELPLGPGWYLVGPSA